MSDLSVLIPARNEEFLKNTIEDIIAHAEMDTEVIAVLDGCWADPPIQDHPRIQLIHHTKSIGQRAATNEAARLSTAKYVMKCDAHCSFDQGFDRKLMAPYESGEIGPDVTTVPRMYNLHVFDWKCQKCGNQTYQGAKPQRCDKCKNTTDFERVMLWKLRKHKRTDFARFDKELHFQYWRDYEKRAESKGDLAEVMSFVGACFLMPRARYWELGGLDEAHGSWGQMGVEISCKSWLSGGRMVTNKRTWFTHLFRTQVGFGFPYPNPGIKARTYSQDLWRNNKWPKQTRPLSWLINKFSPVPDWDAEEVRKLDSSEKLRMPRVHKDEIQPGALAGAVASGETKHANKGILYYTDNRLEARIMQTVQHQILASCNGHGILSVSLKPIEFGFNRVLDLERGYLTMFQQILLGLNDIDAEYVFFCEHDVLYHPSHFRFTPPRKDRYYYNEHTYKVDSQSGQALFYFTKQTSGLCASRDLLLEHYRKRVEKVEREGFTRKMGFEPGKPIHRGGVDDVPAERWMSEFPNIDIRHSQNLTASRWRQDQFRNQKYCQGWKMVDEVPGWGRTKGRFDEFLRGLHVGNK